MTAAVRRSTMIGYRRRMGQLYGRWTVLQAHLAFGGSPPLVKYLPRAWWMRRTNR